MRNIQTLAEVLELEEQQRQRQHQEQTPQQQEDDVQQEQERQLQPGLQLGSEIPPTLLEQLDTLLTDVCKFERMVDNRQKRFIDHISSLHKIPRNVSNLHQIQSEIDLDERMNWEDEIHEQVTIYREKCVDL